MKKLFYIFLSALTLVFAACNKQELAPAEDSSQEGQLTTVTIKASNGDADTKAAISNELAFTWTAGDQIAVHTDNGIFYTSTPLAAGVYTNEAEFTVDLIGNRNGFAVYPASVANTWDGTDLTLTLPDTYTLAQVSGDESPLPMIAEDGGDNLSFKHVAGLLRLTISNIPTGTNKIKLDFNGKKVSGDFVILSPTAGSSSIATASVTKGTDDIIWITGITGTADLTVNIPLPTGPAYNNLAIIAYNGTTPLKGQMTAFTYSASRAHGKKVSSALSLDPYGFSVDGGKQVKFAPANLVLNITEVPVGGGIPTAYTWSFHEHQYDFVGADPDSQVGYTGTCKHLTGNGTFDAAVRLDTFGWVGKSSTVLTGTLSQYGVSNSETQSDYGSTNGESLMSDWGHNSIQSADGGTIYAADYWRTPAISEWTYLFNTRLQASDKYGPATVCGVRGTIIVPDLFIDPKKNEKAGSEGYFVPRGTMSSSEVSWQQNVYTGSNWTDMETAGVIFLPATYYRDGNTIGNLVPTFVDGFYSSSTAVEDAATRYYIMVGIDYNGKHVKAARSSGLSVRLIRDL